VLLLVAVGPLIVGLKIPGVANFSPFLGSIMILVTIIDTIKEQVLALWNKDRYHII
jgi:preprotein translocase subunit SecY